MFLHGIIFYTTSNLWKFQINHQLQQNNAEKVIGLWPTSCWLSIFKFQSVRESPGTGLISYEFRCVQHRHHPLEPVTLRSLYSQCREIGPFLSRTIWSALDIYLGMRRIISLTLLTRSLLALGSADMQFVPVYIYSDNSPPPSHGGEPN